MGECLVKRKHSHDRGKRKIVDQSVVDFHGIHNETFPFLNETFLMHPRLHRKIDSNTEGESKNRNSLIHFDERNISTPFAIPNKTFLVRSDVLGDRMIESLKVNQKCYEEKNSVMSAWS